MTNIYTTQILRRKEALVTFFSAEIVKCTALQRTSRLKAANLMTLFTGSCLLLSMTVCPYPTPFCQVFERQVFLNSTAVLRYSSQIRLSPCSEHTNVFGMQFCTKLNHLV
jgi:hypothetical protein